MSHWLGHADIEMTMRYLAPAEEEVAQAGINKAFAAISTVGVQAGN